MQVSTGRAAEPEEVFEIVAAVAPQLCAGPRRGGRRLRPALALAIRTSSASPIAGVHGQVAGVGHSAHPFTIQSVVKPFLFALVCEALGHREVRDRLGVNATGLPFDSVMAVEIAAED